MPIKALLSLFLVSSVGLAKTGKASAADVEKVLAAYRKAKSIQAKVKKTVEQEVMGTKNESEGDFYFSKGKLRMDMVKPEKSVLVYDGKSIWLESRLDDQHVEVSRLKAGELKKTDSLLAALFDRKDVLNKFKLLKTSVAKGQRIYTFEPREKAKTEVRYLEIALKDKDIRRITYKDQMENRVHFEFSNLSKGSVPAEKFKYKPPKDASITEM